MNKIILAHRGYTKNTIENTISAFELALKNNFNGVELDIHLTKDNEIIIWHDYDLSAVGYPNIKIHKTNWDQLKQIELQKNNNGCLMKEKLLNLETFLELFIDKFEFINIEIKYFNQKFSKIIVNKLNKIFLDKYFKYYHKFIISSFNFKTILMLKKLNFKFKVGLLWKKHIKFKFLNKRKLMLTCDYLHPSYQLLFKNYLKYISFNLFFNVYTISDINTYNECLKYPQIFSIISDIKIVTNDAK